MIKRSLRAFALAVLLSATQLEAAQVTITWRDNSANETGFNIQRKLFTDPDTSYANIGQSAANIATFVDKTVTPDVIYCYRVNAFNTSGQSPWSQPACLLATPDGVVIVYTP
jgi:hypothetical protein